jgi:hypothetical protein
MATKRPRSKQSDDQQQESQEQDRTQEATERREQVQDLQRQIVKAIQPVMDDLQRQITETVRQQLQGGGIAVEPDGAVAGEVGRLDAVGEKVRSSLEPVVNLLQRIWAWIREMVQKLGNKVAELIGELVSIVVQRAIKSAF